jgi:serine/threonine protein kinase
LTRESNRRFHFLREIASGTFGSVYLAKEAHADGFSRLVAIKLLHRRWSESEEVTRRIRDEARLLGWLRHRNIVDVVDLTAIDGRTAVIMEYLEAADLKHIVDHLRDHGGSVPVRAAVQICACVAGALDAAYNRPPYAGEKPLRVIHRDIKPSNVMVDDGGLVKVLDFGVARADFESRESSTADLQFGSVDYMPPERLFFEPETPASDVYSLGAAFYEILALERLGKAKGRPDRHAGFVRDRLSFLRAMRGLGGNLAKNLESLIIAMLDYEHTERPSAARVVEVCRDLARLSADEGLHDWAEHALPPIVDALQHSPTATSPLDGRVVEEDSSALRVRESEAASSFRAIPDPRFDTRGRPITPQQGERERRIGSAALEAMGASLPTPEPAPQPIVPSLEPPAPEPPAAEPPPPAPAPPEPAPAPPAPEPAPAPPAPEPEATPAPTPRRPRQGRASTVSFMPRTYSTGAFPRPGRSRERPTDNRRGTIKDAPQASDFPELGWDDEHEATALVEPELLEALKAASRPSPGPVAAPPPAPAPPPPPAPVEEPPAPVEEPLPPVEEPPPPVEEPPPPVEEPPAPVEEPPPPVEEPRPPVETKPEQARVDVLAEEPTPLPEPVPEAPPLADEGLTQEVTVGMGEEPTEAQVEAATAEAPSDPELDSQAFDDDEPTVMRPGDSVEDSAPPPPPVLSEPPGAASPSPQAVALELPTATAPASPSPTPPSPPAQVAPRPRPKPARRRPPKPRSSVVPSLFLTFCAISGTLLGIALFLGPGRPTSAAVTPAAPLPDPQPEPELDLSPAPEAPVAVGVPVAPEPPDQDVLPPEPEIVAEDEPGIVAEDEPGIVVEPDVRLDPVAELAPEPEEVDAVTPQPETTIDATDADFDWDPLDPGVFELSAQGDLRMLLVRCEGGSEAGASPLQVTMENPGSCTVTAIHRDRSRATAVLESVEHGRRYRCFEDGTNLCLPE